VVVNIELPFPLLPVPSSEVQVSPSGLNAILPVPPPTPPAIQRDPFQATELHSLVKIPLPDGESLQFNPSVLVARELVPDP
jgi:hypothetical protein